MYFSNHIWNNIWKYVYPVDKLNNKFIGNSINNILTKTCYCIICGENDKCTKCESCNDLRYFRCQSCGYVVGHNFICCIDRYNKYGMIN
jgi:hypothetical protein